MLTVLLLLVGLVLGVTIGSFRFWDMLRGLRPIRVRVPVPYALRRPDNRSAPPVAALDLDDYLLNPGQRSARRAPKTPVLGAEEKTPARDPGMSGPAPK
jgi:hypothetical protein